MGPRDYNLHTIGQLATSCTVRADRLTPICAVFVRRLKTHVVHPLFPAVRFTSERRWPPIDDRIVGMSLNYGYHNVYSRLV